MMALKPEALAEALTELKEEQNEKVTLSGRTEERKSRGHRQTDRKKSIFYLRIVFQYIIFFSFLSV